MATYYEILCYEAGPDTWSFEKWSAKRREELGGLFIDDMETSIQPAFTSLHSVIHSHLTVLWCFHDGFAITY